MGFNGCFLVGAMFMIVIVYGFFQGGVLFMVFLGWSIVYGGHFKVGELFMVVIYRLEGCLWW